MTWLDRRAKEVRKRSEPDAAHPAGEKPAGEPDRVDDRRGHAAAGQPLHLPVEEGEVEARVVRDEDGVAGEAEKASDRQLRPGSAAQRRRADTGQCRDHGRQRDARVDERLERLASLERDDALGADLADAGRRRRETCRLQVEDDERRVFEEDIVGSRPGKAHGVAVPVEPRVFADDVVEQ